MNKYKQINKFKNINRFIKHFRKIILYGLVGVLGTLIHFSTLIILVESYNQDPVIGSTIGFILTVIISFVLNRKYTFKTSVGNQSIRFLKYTIVSCFGLALNGMIMYVTVHTWSLHYAIGQALVIAVLPITNYLLNNYWTFREDKKINTDQVRME